MRLELWIRYFHLQPLPSPALLTKKSPTMQPNNQQGQQPAPNPQDRFHKATKRGSVRSYMPPSRSGSDTSSSDDALVILPSAQRGSHSSTESALDHRKALSKGEETSPASSHASLSSVFRRTTSASDAQVSPSLHHKHSAQSISVGSMSGHHQSLPVNALSRLKNTVIHHNRKNRKARQADDNFSMPSVQSSQVSVETAHPAPA